MSQNGPHKGAGSIFYHAAWHFFKVRELRGIKPPRHPSEPKKGQEAVTGAAAGPNLDSIELTGELDDEVAIFGTFSLIHEDMRLTNTDTCDDVRRKINAHLKKPGVIQAQFLRDISASYRKAPRKIQSAQLSAFRSKKGAWEGNTSAVFYGAYVFFEKMRIAEKKPKSKKRVEMEEIHSREGGVDTKRRHQRFWVMKGEAPYVDEYGRVSVF